MLSQSQFISQPVLRLYYNVQKKMKAHYSCETRLAYGVLVQAKVRVCALIEFNYIESAHLQATLASEKDQKSSQIVPHVPLYKTSTRPMCSPYVPLTNRIPSISVAFWPTETE